LNLRLSALENRGAVKIISAPKITTLDNQTAKIGQGVSIPISVVSAAGVNTQFVEAKLELEVTPHITQEGSVLLEVNVMKNEPDFSRTGARGDPTILKKEAETQVMVRDGDTTVIGGIYTRKSSETLSGVPFLSRIPILGFFFRNTKTNDDRTELLIFITPRIVNRLQATVSQK
jgi:type IV pilus assembly protein PilQ